MILQLVHRNITAYARSGISPSTAPSGGGEHDRNRNRLSVVRLQRSYRSLNSWTDVYPSVKLSCLFLEKPCGTPEYHGAQLYVKVCTKKKKISCRLWDIQIN